MLAYEQGATIGSHRERVGSGLDAGEVKVTAKDGEFPAYRAMPATGGPFPTVLLILNVSSVAGRHASTRVIELTENYRSTPEVFASYLPGLRQAHKPQGNQVVLIGRS